MNIRKFLEGYFGKITRLGEFRKMEKIFIFLIFGKIGFLGCVN